MRKVIVAAANKLNNWVRMKPGRKITNDTELKTNKIYLVERVNTDLKFAVRITKEAQGNAFAYGHIIQNGQDLPGSEHVVTVHGFENVYEAR